MQINNNSPPPQKKTLLFKTAYKIVSVYLHQYTELNIMYSDYLQHSNDMEML